MDVDRDRIQENQGIRKRAAMYAESARKADKALQLRLAGHSYDDIAKQAGYASRGAANRAVMRSIRRIPAENAAAVRDLELARLDVLLVSVWPMACRGVLGAVDRCLDIMRRRADMLGLDAPKSATLQLEIAHAAQRIAELQGLDPGELLRTAQEIVSHAQQYPMDSLAVLEQ